MMKSNSRFIGFLWVAGVVLAMQVQLAAAQEPHTNPCGRDSVAAELYLRTGPTCPGDSLASDPFRCYDGTRSALRPER